MSRRNRKLSNHLLSTMSPEDLGRLEPHLQPITLRRGEVIEPPNQPISSIVFPLSGVISVIARSMTGAQLEVGIIGREGMTGVNVLLGADSSPHECYVPIVGEGLWISTHEFKKALAASATLSAHLLSYARLLLLQIAQTAVANGRSKVEERLARWLLMTQDRLDGDEVPLTHELLATMLGVRRAGVTLALQGLEGEGAVRNVRGLIIIRDRERLQVIANGAYQSFLPSPSIDVTVRHQTIATHETHL